jgi:hypothetical protein
MNIIELQDNLKELPDSALMKEMQMPSGNAPQFLVLSELKRRKRMRDDFQRREAADMPTVAEETITAAGMPQEGIMQAASAMAPKSSIAQNTGMDMAMPMQATQAPQQPQMMAEGGIMRLNEGAKLNSLQKQFNPAVLELSLGGQYGSDVQREVVGNALAGAYGPEMQSNVLAQARDGAYGSFIQEAVLGAVSQNATPDPSSGFFPNDADLATVGGEGIGSVSADIEDFAATDDGISAQTDVANMLDVMSQANQGIPREGLPEFTDNDLRFSRGTASSLAPSAGSEAINDMRAGADLAQLSGGIGRVSADLSNVETAPQGIDFNAAESVDSELPIRGADTKASQELAEFLASRRSDVPGANLPGDSYVYEIDPNAALRAGESLSSDDDVAMADLMAQAQIEREGFGAGQVASTLSGDNFSNDPTTGYSYPTDLPPLDPRMEGREVAGRVIDALTEGEGGGLPEGIYGGYEDPEAIARRQEIERMISLEPLGDGMQGDVETVVDEAAKKAAQTAMTTGTGLVIPSEEDGGIASLLPPSLTGGDAGGDAGGTSTGSADFGSIESRIARMLADREKGAEADKWMSLAQAGMALMASKNPTFGGALGEAGLAGIGSMQKARSQYDKDILGLLGMQQQIESAKDLSSYRQASLDAKDDKAGLRPSDLIGYLGTLQKEQTDLTKQLSENLTGDPKLTQQRLAINEVEIERIKRMLGYGGTSATDLAD